MKIIIFAGGFGTRMWPASRKKLPKQFFPILGGKSFFQLTLKRFRKGFPYRDIYVSTEERYVNLVLKQAPSLPPQNVISEPERRDLMGAVGLVTATIEKRHPGSVMFFSWSDHFIRDEAVFIKAVKEAGKYTKSTGRPVSIDEVPTFASVHHGWLKLGKKVHEDGDYKFLEIQKHIEKPNSYTAKRLFRSDKYLLHTGYGAWRSDVLLGYYKEYASETYNRLVAMMSAMGKKSEREVLKREYGKIEKISVEFGLFEKIPAKTRLTIPVNTGWSDLGTWQLFYEAFADHTNGRSFVDGANYTFIDSSGNLVLGQKEKMVSIVGVSDIVVIDTRDGLLITSLSKSALVRDLYKSLERDHPKYVD